MSTVDARWVCWSLFCFFTGARQEELSVCVDKKSALAWSKEMMLVQKTTNLFFTQSTHKYNSSSSSPPANEANRKIKKIAKNWYLGPYFNISSSKLSGNLFHSPCQRNWRMLRYNSSQVTFANSIPFSEYVFFFKLIFRVFCYS